MSFVLPGVEDVIARRPLPVSILISELLPTFDLPMKANSGNLRPGLDETLVQLPANFASVIFIAQR